MAKEFPPCFKFAIAYARRGWKVFPSHGQTPEGKCTCKRPDCDSPGKHPAVKGGFTAATTVEGIILAWWQRWPNANVAITTGKPAGFWVLDIDPRHGGDASLRELERQHGELPTTAETITGGGGRHLLFTLPSDGLPVRCSSSIIGAGIDTRGDGGYIVAPPSIHANGRAYEWEACHDPDDVPIIEAPAWVLAALNANGIINGKRRVEPLPERLTEGSRHDHLVSVAGSLHYRGATSEDIADSLLAINAHRCTPPLDEDHIRRLAASTASWKRVELPPEVTAAAPEDDAAQPAPAPSRTVLVSGQRYPLEVTTNISEMATIAVKGLELHPDVELFQRSGRIVQIVRNETGARIQPVEPATVMELLSAIFDWQRVKKSADGSEAESFPAYPPKPVVEAIIARPRLGLPVIRSIIEAPTLRPNGSLLATKGYDPTTGIYYAPNGLQVKVPDHPTRADALAAMDDLLDVFVDFPIRDKACRSAAVACLITGIIRGAINGPVPLFEFGGNAQGAGKTRAAQVCGVVWTGRNLPVTPEIGEGEEEGKRITAIYASAEQFVFIDNVLKRFGSGQLGAAITSGSWKNRRMGSFQTDTFHSSAIWLITGNNVAYNRELIRRVITITLQSDMENPADRVGFVHPVIEDYVRQRRAQLVSAALTVVRAYIEAGWPVVEMARFGSFEEWARWVAAPIVWLGHADPTACRLRAADDDSLADWGLMLRQWSARYGAQSMTVREAVNDADDALKDTMTAMAPPEKSFETASLKVLGYIFRSNVNRVVGGYRLIRTSGPRVRACVPYHVERLTETILFNGDEKSACRADGCADEPSAAYRQGIGKGIGTAVKPD